MFLVDTNVWLEVLLEQDRAPEAERFISQTPSNALFISDFAFHSIGLTLYRLNSLELLLAFTNDIFGHGNVGRISLLPTDIPTVIGAIGEFRLDFDDAYQYVAAEKHGLAIVSFDADFDRTQLGRRLPIDLL